MAEPLPSPKRRLRAVYSVPDGAPRRSERVIYQLEDTGHPVLRLRPTVRLVEENGADRVLYRVDAFSRLSGAHLGQAEVIADQDSPADFAARAREFQSEPFREVMTELSEALVERFGDRELAASQAAVTRGST
jgi:hypothetical protein